MKMVALTAAVILMATGCCTHATSVPVYQVTVKHSSGTNVYVIPGNTPFGINIQHDPSNPPQITVQQLPDTNVVRAVAPASAPAPATVVPNYIIIPVPQTPVPPPAQPPPTSTTNYYVIPAPPSASAPPEPSQPPQNVVIVNPPPVQYMYTQQPFTIQYGNNVQYYQDYPNYYPDSYWCFNREYGYRPSYRPDCGPQRVFPYHGQPRCP